MKTYIIATVAIIMVVVAEAQQRTTIVVLARYDGQRMQLRWAPTSPTLWELGIRHGYTVERFTLDDNGDMLEDSNVMLTATPVTVWSEYEFAAASGISREVAILGELLYDKESKAERSSDFGALRARHQELENRFGMALLMCDLSPRAAHAAGMSFTDASVRSGARYVYRVSIAKATQADATGVLMKTATEEKPLIKMSDLKATFGDRNATLSWSTLLHKGEYTAYYVERSAGGTHFTRLSELPYVHMSEVVQSGEVHFVDSLADNKQTYYYRVCGINPFGMVGPYSNIVEGHGKANLSGTLVVKEAHVLDGRRVRIVWEFPATAEKLISGFTVAWSTDPAKPYDGLKSPLYNPSSRHGVLEIPHSNTYFVVRAMDEENHEITRSFPYLVQVADTIAPIAPSGLIGEVDDNGIVTVRWNVNAEHDLLGYRVFRASTPDEESVEVTSELLVEAEFRQAINIEVLTRPVFYTVVAVDRNYNASSYSAPLKLTRPDKHPPVAPVIAKLEVRSDTVMLEWSNSSSDDVRKHELVKTDLNERVSRTILTWYPSSPVSVFKDTRLVAGTNYQYRIIAMDSAGNSNAVDSRVFEFEPGFRPAIQQLSGEVDRDARQIRLAWVNPLTSTGCAIYRSKNQEPFRLLETLEGNIISYVDTEIEINNNYAYKVQPVYPRGIRSIISEEVRLAY